MSERTDQDTAALICEHGVDLDDERCAKCDEHEAEHDRVFEAERP